MVEDDIRRLKLGPRWQGKIMAAKHSLGAFLTLKMTSRVLTANGCETMGHVEEGIAAIAEITQDKTIPAEERIAAVRALAEISATWGNLSTKVMELAKVGSTKEATEKPKVRPPTFAMQVNVQSAPAQAPASDAKYGRPAIDVPPGPVS